MAFRCRMMGSIVERRNSRLIGTEDAALLAGNEDTDFARPARTGCHGSPAVVGDAELVRCTGLALANALHRSHHRGPLGHSTTGLTSAKAPSAPAGAPLRKSRSLFVMVTILVIPTFTKFRLVRVSSSEWSFLRRSVRHR
jgi:hypothetical protein